MLTLFDLDLLNPIGQIFVNGEHLAHLTKARMITMFIWTARLLDKTEDNMATPSFRECPLRCIALPELINLKP